MSGMPNKLATSTTLCLLLFFGLPTQAQDSPPFPKEGQRLEVYDRLISEIHRVDAIGIATRNTYKDLGRWRRACNIAKRPASAIQSSNIENCKWGG